MEARRKFGNEGERCAAEFLKKKGYRLLAEQWRIREGEIDLIMQDRDEIVCVEVKTRRTVMFGPPEAAVTRRKLEKLRRLAESYCKSKNWHGKYRIDVVGILYSGGVPEIWHVIGV